MAKVEDLRSLDSLEPQDPVTDRERIRALEKRVRRLERSNDKISHVVTRALLQMASWVQRVEKRLRGKTPRK